MLPLPNNKSVSIELDADSWAPAQPPQRLAAAAAAGPYTVDLDAALVFIGIWTQPPTRTGFSLADCWAWLRYFPAFSSAIQLRLCEEWSHVDSHQKTVASDELGVGLTTWLLHRTLGFQRFSDSNWVMNVLSPDLWRYRSHARRGPSKSPDYIAEDSAGRLSVLECKGTQSSLAELRRAVDRGRPQKQNIVPQGGTVLIHSLVAGAFIPQWSNNTPATVFIADPEWESLTEELQKHSAEDIRASTKQVAYAKELAFFELAESAEALVRFTEEPVALVSALNRDITSLRSAGALEDNTVTFTRQHSWSKPLKRDGEEYVGVRLRGKLDLDRLEPIRYPSAQYDARESISEATATMEWQESRTEHGTRLISPIGAEYSLEWLSRS